MNVFVNPPVVSWPSLCTRPVVPSAEIEAQVESIIEQVKLGGDAALRQLTLQYDQFPAEQLQVSAEEIERAAAIVPAELKKAIALAAENIRKFHAAQKSSEPVIETMPGITCWRKCVPIENVGLYIPGGSAPLFSTILMLAIPAQIAGCRRIFMCTPANSKGEIDPAVLYTASYLNVTEIFKAGGAQAIAAMAFGTQTIPKADKIFGPGNQYVTKAKELVQRRGAAIDLPAGPSEVLIIADGNANADFVAADLLSQAEHGSDSQVVLLTDDPQLTEKVRAALEKQLEELPRKNIALKALANSFAILFLSLENCIDFSNVYAPEHLILAVEDPEGLANKVKNAGSVFLGTYACESAGDYASGTNHTLPTNGNAKSYSGISLDSFIKKISFQRITKQGLQNIGEAVERMAEAEQLAAHSNAVRIRLKTIADEN